MINHKRAFKIGKDKEKNKGGSDESYIELQILRNQ